MIRVRINCRERPTRLFPTLFLLSWALVSSSGLASAQVSSRKKALPCKTSQLSAVNDRKESDTITGGVGHHAITIAIENRSSSYCVLRGVPKVTLSYYPSGRSFALRTCANCLDYLFSRQPDNAILLKPQGSAYLVLGYNVNDGNGTCTEADPKFMPRFRYPAMTLGLYLVDQEEPLRVVFGLWRSCGAIDVTPFLKQPPMHGALPRRNNRR
jgi:hypothetical protein